MKVSKSMKYVLFILLTVSNHAFALTPTKVSLAQFEMNTYDIDVILSDIDKEIIHLQNAMQMFRFEKEKIQMLSENRVTKLELEKDKAKRNFEKRQTAAQEQFKHDAQSAKNNALEKARSRATVVAKVAPSINEPQVDIQLLRKGSAVVAIDGLSVTMRVGSTVRGVTLTALSMSGQYITYRFNKKIRTAYLNVNQTRVFSNLVTNKETKPSDDDVSDFDVDLTDLQAGQ